MPGSPGRWRTARRDKAHVPEEAAFTTKPTLGTQMITGAADAGIPFAWMAGDEVYGRSSRLREACEQAGKGYVLAVPVNFTVTLPSGRKAPVSAVAAMIPGHAWETRSCGRGCKGHRDYEWAWARQRARPGQGQRPRSTPSRPPCYPAHDHRRPPARIRLVAPAPPPPGPCPLAPQPCPTQSRPGHLSLAERKEAAINKTGL